VRTGVYFQEARAHQVVWGSAEIHPDHSDPGLVTIGGSFSLISSLGISSIPFREYLVFILIYPYLYGINYNINVNVIKKIFICKCRLRDRSR